MSAKLIFLLTFLVLKVSWVICNMEDPIMESKNMTRTSEDWPCPEHAFSFAGFDIGTFDNIPSWQECGRLSILSTFSDNRFLGRICQDESDCDFWTWDVPNGEYYPSRCWLKSVQTGAEGRYEGFRIFGDNFFPLVNLY
jgi:hypothetical protein